MPFAVLHDLRFAARSLARRPGFTVAIAVTLALGIGANTAVYSLVDAVLLRRLPFPDDERLVAVWSTVRRDVVERREMSYPDFADVAAGAEALEVTAALISSEWTLAGGDGAERLAGEIVTPGYLPLLGVAPAIGRGLAAETPEVAEVVIGHGLWQRRWAGDPEVLGERLRLDDSEHTVVGVMPAGFTGLNPDTEVWVSLPALAPAELLERRGQRFLSAVARLAPGAGIERARDEVAAIGGALASEYPDSNTSYGVSLGPLRPELMGDLETPLLVLSAVVLFVLLIACANVANLMLVRAAGRQRESAVHAALGAGPGRLLGRAVLEALLLGLLGGALGVGIAAWGLEALLAASPVRLPDFVAVGIDPRVLGFSLALTLATALALGVFTARRGGGRLADTLRPGSRGGSGSPAARRTRGVLVGAEVALALVLLVGAGLMIASFTRLAGVEPGFRGDGLVFLRVDLAATGWEDDELTAFGPRLTEALSAVPGVESAALSSDTPLQQGWSATILTPEGRELDPEAPYGGATRVYRHLVGPEFFATVGLPLVEGRAFRPGDGELEAPPVVVSAELARRTWPGETAVGRQVKLGPPDSEQPWRQVVGVTADARYRRVTGDPVDTPDDPDVFFPLEGVARDSLAVSVRSSLAPAALAPTLRQTVQRLAPEVAVFGLETPAGRLARQRTEPRFTALMMGLFAALALALAAVGVYGVMAYSVAERTQEIGVRMALGAREGSVLGMVVRQGMAPVVLGIVAGLGLALALARLLASLLYEVRATEPAVYAAVSVTLLAVALAACLLPARRASRVDPMIALRHE